MKLLKIIIALFSTITFAQSKEGYWDEVRMTNETISIKSNEKKIIKTAAFPEGTTEVVFRVTVLDDNQELSSSLVSLLKAVPDPTGISQSSAGALFLVSKIAGDDKCKLAVFNSQIEAEKFKKDGKTTEAIFIQEEPVNKIVKLLKGFNAQTTNLWFVFESDNWLLKEKVTIEVVPWVDYNESKGWNKIAKNKIITQAKQSEIYKEVSKKELFIGQLLELVVEKYTYKDFNKLLPEEKKQTLSVLTELSLSKIGDDKALANLIRSKSKKLFDSGKKQEAIDLMIQELVDKSLANQLDYNVIGKYFLLTNQLERAENFIKKGIVLDESELKLKLNLAHVYLLKSEFSKAKEIHKMYKTQNVSSDVTWSKQTRLDFDEFEKANITSKDFKRILKILD